MEHREDRTLDGCVTYRVLRFGFALMLALVVLAIFPYTPRPTEEIKILIYQGAASLFLGIFLIHSVVTRRAFERPPLLFSVLMALLALYAVTALASDYVAHSLVEWSKWASLIALYVVASQVYRTERSIRVLLVSTCVAVALSSLYAFMQKAGVDPFPWNEALRENAVYKDLPATFGNPNIAGHTLIVVFILSLYLATLPGTRWCILFTAVFVAHMAFTNQRSGIFAIGAAGTIVVLAVLFRRLTKRPVLVVAGVIATLTVLVCAGIASIGVWAHRTGGGYAPIDTSLRLRYNAYYSAIEMLHEKPILGYGPGNYRIVNTPFWTPYEQQWFAGERLMNFNVHNDFLEAAVDAGLLGGLLYTTFFALAIGGGIYLYAQRRDPRERRLCLALAAAFFAFATDGFFGFNVRVPVSAVLILVLAGVLDGFFAYTLQASESTAHRERSYFWPTVLGGAAVANAVFAGAVFFSEVYFQRGEGAQYWKAYAAAEDAYSRGERLAPWNWLFPYRLGIAFTSQGNGEAAAGQFQECLQKNPFYIPAMSYLAQNYFNQAAPVLVSANPAPALVSEANILLDRAEDRAQNALTLCATWPESDDILGRIEFVRAMWVHNSRPAARSPYGTPEALWRSAAAHFERGLADGLEQSKEPLRLLAQIHLFLNEPDRVEQYLFDALDTDVHDSTTWSTFWEYASVTCRRRAMRPTRARSPMPTHGSPGSSTTV